MLRPSKGHRLPPGDFVLVTLPMGDKGTKQVADEACAGETINKGHYFKKLWKN